MKRTSLPLQRRTFIAGLGSAAAWPLAARAQQPALPVVGFVHAGSANASADRVSAFRKGLSETGYVEGQNVTVKYHWVEGQYDRLPGLVADLVGRHVAVIAAPFQPAEDSVDPAYAVCCARATTGHAAARPSPAMNVRRLIIRSPRRLAVELTAAPLGRAPWPS